MFDIKEAEGNLIRRKEIGNMTKPGEDLHGLYKTTEGTKDLL